MKPMKREFKEKDALLRPHKESTLEKNEAKRVARREMLNKEFNKIVKDKF
jgi:hypothetical protein